MICNGNKFIIKTALGCCTEPETLNILLFRLHQGGEWRPLARLPILLQGVQEAKRSCSPHPHPHPREAFQVQTVLQSLCRQEHTHGTHENAHGHQGVWVSVLSEMLLHFWQHESAHASAYRWEADPLQEKVRQKAKINWTLEHIFKNYYSNFLFVLLFVLQIT